MKKNKTKPNIRFKGFTDDWEQRKFGDLGSVAMCKRIFKDQTSENGDIPFYKIGTFGSTPDAFISKSLYEEYKVKYQFPEVGDLLLSASGTIGRIVEYKGENAYFQDSNIIWFKHDNRLLNTFLKPVYEITEWSGIEGSTIKRLYNSNILNTYLPFTSINEQTKIGQYFSQLDNLITLHQRECNQLKELKKTMLKKMFPCDGSNIPEVRFAGFTDDWEQRKLGDLAEIVGGGTPNTSIQEYWDGEIDWYTPAEISNNIYVNSSERKITSAGYENSSAKMLPIGTVLFTSRAGIGKTAILRKKSCTNQGFQSIVPYHNQLDTYFIYSRTDELKRYGETTGAGSTFVEVSGKQMGKMNIFIPRVMDEQVKIGQYFSRLDNLITLHQRELEILKNLKKTCLKRMFI